LQKYHVPCKSTLFPTPAALQNRAATATGASFASRIATLFRLGELKRAGVPSSSIATAYPDCLTIEDQGKERLDCYDAKIAPQPKQISASVKTVEDCRFVKEQDERLNCFNRFVRAPSSNMSAGPSKRILLSKN